MTKGKRNKRLFWNYEKRCVLSNLL
jgi:hypothetical protein